MEETPIEFAHPLRAQWYADEALPRRVKVLENTQVAEATWRLRLACPEIAERILPGQFLMIRLSDRDDPLLGRAFALYDTAGDDEGQVFAIDVVYLVMGRMTSRLTGIRSGDDVEVWGPLGNGFEPTTAKHLIMVAGGIGQTPFLAVAQEALAEKTYGRTPRNWPNVETVELLYGIRTARFAAGVEDFQAVGVDVHLASDDGSIGFAGFVTDLLEDRLSKGAFPNGEVEILSCGPEPMMERVSEIAQNHSIACRVSLESPMACGVGICFSCVTRVATDNELGWDYKRTCVDGPVFSAQEIIW